MQVQLVFVHMPAEGKGERVGESGEGKEVGEREREREGRME